MQLAILDHGQLSEGVRVVQWLAQIAPRQGSTKSRRATTQPLLAQAQGRHCPSPPRDATVEH